jgi:hypothetical protein
MRVGLELLQLAGAGARTIFVVGTGRDVGKTTALRALYAAARDLSQRIGLASIGREERPKRRLWLRPQTCFVTARAALGRTPAVEILKLSRLPSPAGPLLYARALSSAFYELVGPPAASGVREMIEEMHAYCDLVIVDGAVDRIAALAGSCGAIVAACGAAAAKTQQEAVADIAGLVGRLRVAAYDPCAPALHVDGALTAEHVASLIAQSESRQIVVRDPTQIVLSGRAATQALERLKLRCRRPLSVIAVTVASIAVHRSFEPRAFADAVAAASGLPTFDVYAGTRAA